MTRSALSTPRSGLLAALLLTASAPALACTGDCDGDGQVAINEAVRGVNIALGNAPVGECAQFDANDDGMVSVNELIAAVGSVLDGCPSTTPTPSPRATPGPDTPFTLVIEEGAGVELFTGRAYPMYLSELLGSVRTALYLASLDEDDRVPLVDLSLWQTVLDSGGTIIRDAEGRRITIYLRIGHLPARVGTYQCGGSLPERPGALLTLDVTASLRDDVLLSEVAIEEYFGYPLSGPEVGCTVTVTSVDDGFMVGSYEADMLNSRVSDLAHATGRFRLPIPACTHNEATTSPATCYPWAF
jgi:hypothetical protein